MLRCDTVCGGGAQREQWRLLHSLPVLSHSLRYPQSNWALLVLLPEWVCARSRPLWVSPVNSSVRRGVSPMLPQPPQVFSIIGLRLYFLVLELWVARFVTWSTNCCLASQLQLCPPCSTIHHLSGSAIHRCLAGSPLCPPARLLPSFQSG